MFCTTTINTCLQIKASSFAVDSFSFVSNLSSKSDSLTFCTENKWFVHEVNRWIIKPGYGSCVCTPARACCLDPCPRDRWCTDPPRSAAISTKTPEWTTWCRTWEQAHSFKVISAGKCQMFGVTMKPGQRWLEPTQSSSPGSPHWLTLDLQLLRVLVSEAQVFARRGLHKGRQHSERRVPWCGWNSASPEGRNLSMLDNVCSRNVAKLTSLLRSFYSLFCYQYSELYDWHPDLMVQNQLGDSFNHILRTHAAQAATARGAQLLHKLYHVWPKNKALLYLCHWSYCHQARQQHWLIYLQEVKEAVMFINLHCTYLKRQFYISNSVRVHPACQQSPCVVGEHGSQALHGFVKHGAARRFGLQLSWRGRHLGGRCLERRSRAVGG